MEWDFEKDPYKRGFLEGYGRHLITSLRREGYPECRVREITVSELIDRFEMTPGKAGEMAENLILHSSWPLGRDPGKVLEMKDWRVRDGLMPRKMRHLISDREETVEILEIRTCTGKEEQDGAKKGK